MSSAQSIEENMEAVVLSTSLPAGEDQPPKKVKKSKSILQRFRKNKKTETGDNTEVIADETSHQRSLSYSSMDTISGSSSFASSTATADEMEDSSKSKKPGKFRNFFKWMGKSKKGKNSTSLNPFDDEEAEIEPEEEQANDAEPMESNNGEIEENEKNNDQMHGFNPFESDDDEEIEARKDVELEEQKEERKEDKLEVVEESNSTTLNPFETKMEAEMEKTNEVRKLRPSIEEVKKIGEMEELKVVKEQVQKESKVEKEYDENGLNPFECDDSKEDEELEMEKEQENEPNNEEEEEELKGVKEQVQKEAEVDKKDEENGFNPFESDDTEEDGEIHIKREQEKESKEELEKEQVEREPENKTEANTDVFNSFERNHAEEIEAREVVEIEESKQKELEEEQAKEKPVEEKEINKNGFNSCESGIDEIDRETEVGMEGEVRQEQELEVVMEIEKENMKEEETQVNDYGKTDAKKQDFEEVKEEEKEDLKIVEEETAKKEEIEEQSKEKEEEKTEKSIFTKDNTLVEADTEMEVGTEERSDRNEDELVLIEKNANKEKQEPIEEVTKKLTAEEDEVEQKKEGIRITVVSKPTSEPELVKESEQNAEVMAELTGTNVEELVIMEQKANEENLTPIEGPIQEKMEENNINKAKETEHFEEVSNAEEKTKETRVLIKEEPVEKAASNPSLVLTNVPKPVFDPESVKELARDEEVTLFAVPTKTEMAPVPKPTTSIDTVASPPKFFAELSSKKIDTKRNVLFPATFDVTNGKAEAVYQNEAVEEPKPTTPIETVASQPKFFAELLSKKIDTKRNVLFPTTLDVIDGKPEAVYQNEAVEEPKPTTPIDTVASQPKFFAELLSKKIDTKRNVLFPTTFDVTDGKPEAVNQNEAVEEPKSTTPIDQASSQSNLVVEHLPKKPAVPKNNFLFPSSFDIPNAKEIQVEEKPEEERMTNPPTLRTLPNGKHVLVGGKFIATPVESRITSVTYDTDSSGQLIKVEGWVDENFTKYMDEALATALDDFDL